MDSMRSMQGYGNPAFESRSLRVSQNKAWHQVRRGLREVALIAEDEGTPATTRKRRK